MSNKSIPQDTLCSEKPDQPIFTVRKAHKKTAALGRPFLSHPPALQKRCGCPCFSTFRSTELLPQETGNSGHHNEAENLFERAAALFRSAVARTLAAILGHRPCPHVHDGFPYGRSTIRHQAPHDRQSNTPVTQATLPRHVGLVMERLYRRISSATTPSARSLCAPVNVFLTHPSHPALRCRRLSMNK